MAKYSYEFKKIIVQDYLAGKGSYRYLGEKYAIPWEYVRKWVRNYNTNGDESLLRSRKQSKYSFEYKLHVVELYLSSEVSYQELAISLGIHNPAQICKWVNDFQSAGPDTLRPKKKGRKKSLDSKIKEKTAVQTVNEITVDTSVEHVKQLEDELLKLRIENAYLKELRRLRLEEETLLKKQRESSTASEESSD